MPRNFYRKLKSGANLEVIIKLGVPNEFHKRAYSLFKLEVIIYFKIRILQSLTNVRNNVPESHYCWHAQRPYRALGVEDFIATVNTCQAKCVHAFSSEGTSLLKIIIA